MCGISCGPKFFEAMFVVVLEGLIVFIWPRLCLKGHRNPKVMTTKPLQSPYKNYDSPSSKMSDPFFSLLQKDSHHISRVRSNQIYIPWHICLQHNINTRMHLPAAANTTGPSSPFFFKSKQVDPMVQQHIMSWKKLHARIIVDLEKQHNCIHPSVCTKIF